MNQRRNSRYFVGVRSHAKLYFIDNTMIYPLLIAIAVKVFKVDKGESVKNAAELNNSNKTKAEKISVGITLSL